MDLDALAIKLRAEAKADSAIVLDNGIFSNAVLENIRTAFGLPSGTNLTITGVRETDIPEPVGGFLTISAGTASVLKQKEAAIGLRFTASGDLVDAIISAAMGTAWEFSHSFDGLDVFPFNDIKTNDAFFVYSTAKDAAYGVAERSSSVHRQT